MESKRPDKIRIVCVSDTHNAHSSISLPKGDILIHAGDLTNRGSYNELKKSIDWISQANFAVKIVIAGNHELSLDSEYALKHGEGCNVIATEADVSACRDLMLSNANIVYLQHTSAVVQVPIAGKTEMVALRVFGSPYSPGRGERNAWAFQYGENAAAAMWDVIPEDVDILITHTPPKGYRDASRHWDEGGCNSLSMALSRVRPLLHVCGHCHEGRGVEVVDWDDKTSNASAIRTWQDPGAGNNKKQSILDLTKEIDGGSLQRGMTAIVNASIMANSHGRAKTFNKPIVIYLPLQHAIG